MNNHFFISNRFHGTQNNFGPLNDHIISEFSQVVIMVTGHAQHCHLAVTCPVTVATVKTIAIAGYLPSKVTQNHISGISNINAWLKRHGAHIMARFECNFVCHVTYLPNSPRGGHVTNFLTAVTYGSQSYRNFYWQKNNYVQNLTVELAYWPPKAANQWWGNVLCRLQATQRL